MLVSATHKLVLLDAQHQANIARVIPHAKPWAHAGTQYVVVPHRLEEARLLRNMGFPVPSPIETQYDWPKPSHVKQEAPHQVTSAAFLTLNRRAFLLNEIGTMKTLTAYWAIDYLKRLKIIRRVVVVSTKSTLKLVHADTIWRTFIDYNFTILLGDAKKRRNLVKHDFDFYIVNPEGVEIVLRELIARGDIDLVLIDECAKYRNATRHRWKALHDLIASKPNMWVWGMTGRPTPNEPTDAYGQVRLINPNMLQRYGYTSFRAFKEATMTKVSMFRWVPKDNAQDTVAKVMQPSIRFSKDVLKLDKPLVHDRECDLTPAQKKAFNEMLRHFITEVNGGQVTALNEAVKVMRLIQTVTGTVYDVNGNHQHIDCGPRLEVVKEIIEEAGRKTIVYVPFTGNLFFLKDLLEKEGYSVAQVYGGTKQAERDQILYDFQHHEHPQVLVAHPACMSHGLTLTAANTIVWWGPIDSNETYTQANGRIDRKGQEHAMNIFHISATSAERKVFQRLKNKQRLEGTLLEIIEEMRA